MQSDEGAISSSIASLDYVDLSDYCRLCLQIPEESQLLDLQLIYDEEEQLSYYDCFIICTQIDLHAGGIYAPHQLCKSCGLELQVAYDFHKKVQESKKFLNQFQKSHITDGEILNTTLTKDDTSQVTDLVIEEVVHKTSDETQLPVPIQLENESTENEVVTTEEENVEQLDANIEYEELEEHIEMEEYPTVEELIDDDNEKEQRTAAIKLEEDAHISSTDISTDESVSGHYLTVANTDIPPVLINLPPPSDTDDINLEEYLFENPASSEEIRSEPLRQEVKTSTKSKSSSGKRGRVPLIPGGPPFQCEYCDHKSPTRSLLASHRHRKHRFNKPPNKCAECGKEFATKQQLERHQQRVSCQSYPLFKCEFCEKTCIGRANYNIHLRFHKKVYPYVCHICAKPFMMAQHLNNHVKTKHEGQRFICEEANCGKMFQTAHALKNHAYTHVDQLPYRCDYCQQDFATKGRLRWHISRTHGIEHTLDELDCMLVAKELKLKAKLRPALTPEPIQQCEEVDAADLEG
ncbi:zinc finger and SCAN domain-containing protein 12 isoform X1 [Bactrocera tryoni]|uniref:zinc finger and SCAN domain-containing protein 12 isoform X1 n=1 Tax=Bactrocera tryoni TaxID=59916 RepID=UPI001A9629C4|nr:zinc finger and SCAN domain-containing protein 12 isoform X1 [Bactrocera tryoni]